MTPEERFWARVEKTPTCWNWTGSLGSGGYGQVQLKSMNHRAHRVAWEWLRGPIPEDRQIDHLCRNRRCVNVAHMELVTLRENVLRGVGLSAQNARKTHCPLGHPLSTERRKHGSRFCRPCAAAASRRSWRKYHPLPRLSGLKEIP